MTSLSATCPHFADRLGPADLPYPPSKARRNPYEIMKPLDSLRLTACLLDATQACHSTIDTDITTPSRPVAPLLPGTHSSEYKWALADVVASGCCPAALGPKY